MQLAYALLADAAEFTPDGRIWVLGGDVDTLYVEHLPALHPLLVVVLKWRISPAEAGQEHPYHLRIQLFDPDGNALAPALTGTFTAQVDPALPERPIGVGITLALQQQQFHREGEHSVGVWLNEQEQIRLPLYVVRTPLPVPKLVFKLDEQAITHKSEEKTEGRENGDS